MIVNDSKNKINFMISRVNDSKEFKKLKQYNLKKAITQYNLKIKIKKNKVREEEINLKSKSNFSNACRIIFIDQMKINLK